MPDFSIPEITYPTAQSMSGDFIPEVPDYGFGDSGYGPVSMEQSALLGYEQMQEDVRMAMERVRIGAIFGAQRLYRDTRAAGEYLDEEGYLSRARATEYDSKNTTFFGSLQYALGLPSSPARNMTEGSRQSIAQRDLAERFTVATGAAATELALPWGLGLAASAAFGGPIGLVAGVGAAIGADAFINADIYRDHLARGSFIESSSGRYIRPGISRDVDGKGFSRQEVGELVRFIEEMGHGEEFFTGEELDSLTKEFTFSGVFDAARSVDDFKNKFEEAKDNLKLIMQQMGTTIEEGTTLMRDFASMGIGPEDVPGAIQSAKLVAGNTGMSSRASMNAMLTGGAQVFAGTGFDMTMGSDMMALNMSRVGLMESRGAIDDETIRQMGGVQGASQALTQMQGRLLESRPVQDVMRAAFRGTDQPDLDIIGRVLSGELSGFQLARLARSNMLGGQTNRLEFAGRYDELVENLPTPVAQALAAYPIIERAQNLKRRHPEIDITPAMLRGIATEDLGYGRNEADLLVSSITELNIDEIIANQMGSSQLAGDRVPYSGYSWLHPLDSTALFGRRMYNQFVVDPFLNIMDRTQEAIHRGLRSTQGIETFEGRTMVPLAMREKMEIDQALGAQAMEFENLTGLVDQISPEDMERRGPQGTIEVETPQGEEAFFDTGDTVRALAEGDYLFNQLSEGNFEQFRRDLDADTTISVSDLTQELKSRISPEMTVDQKKVELFRLAREENMSPESPKEMLALQEVAKEVDPEILSAAGEFSGALGPDMQMTSDAMQRSMQRLEEMRQEISIMPSEYMDDRLLTDETIQSARTTTMAPQGVTMMDDEKLRSDIVLEHRARNQAAIQRIAYPEGRDIGPQFITGDIAGQMEQMQVELAVQTAGTPEEERENPVVSMLNAFEQRDIDITRRPGQAAFRQLAETMDVDLSAYLQEQRESIPTSQRQVFRRMTDEYNVIAEEQEEVADTGAMTFYQERLQGVTDLTDDILPGLFTYTETEALRDAVNRGEMQFDPEDVFRGAEEDLRGDFVIIDRDIGPAGEFIEEEMEREREGTFVAGRGRLATSQSARGARRMESVFAVRREALEDQMKSMNERGRRMMELWDEFGRDPEDRRTERREGLMGALGILQTSIDGTNKEAFNAFSAYVADQNDTTREALQIAMESRIGADQTQEFMRTIDTEEGMDVFRPLAIAPGERRPTHTQRTRGDEAARNIDNLVSSMNIRDTGAERRAERREGLTEALDAFGDEDSDAFQAFSTYAEDQTESNREALQIAMESRIGADQTQEFMRTIDTEEGMDVFRPLLDQDREMPDRREESASNIDDLIKIMASEEDPRAFTEQEAAAVNRINLSDVLDELEDPDTASLGSVMAGIVRVAPELFDTTAEDLEDQSTADILGILEQDPEKERQAMELLIRSGRARSSIPRDDTLQRTEHLITNAAKQGMTISRQRVAEELEEQRSEAIKSIVSQTEGRTGTAPESIFFEGYLSQEALPGDTSDEKRVAMGERVEDLYELYKLQQSEDPEAYTAAVAQFREKMGEDVTQLLPIDEKTGRIDFSGMKDLFTDLQRIDIAQEDFRQEVALSGKSDAQNLISALREGEGLSVSEEELKELVPSGTEEDIQEFAAKTSRQLKGIVSPTDIETILSPEPEDATDSEKTKREEIARDIEAFGREGDMKTDVRTRGLQMSPDQTQAALVDVLWALKGTLDALGPNLRSSSAYWSRGGR